MRKIDKSPNVPTTLVGAPVPTSATEVRKEIYKADDVRKQLMIDQGRKCAYCECRVRTAYNDVEHYRPKVAYFWLGHTWQNLLYSCNECNRTYKKHYFPLRDETARNLTRQDISCEDPLIVNPVEEEPSLHIKFKRYEAVPLTDKGEATIRLFQLNNRNELIADRKEVFEHYHLIEQIRKLQTIRLSKPELSAEERNEAERTIDFCRKSIDFQTSPSTPYSGMLIAQI